MKTIKFKEANKCLRKPPGMTDEECGSLWVHCDGRECVSCWTMNWKERLAALFFGRIWLFVMFGETQPPVSVMCCKTVFEEPKEAQDDKR